MSLKRLIYYSALIGGWSAFFGWLAAEILLNRRGIEGRVGVALTCALVGGAIGAGLNLVAGMANAQWKQQLKRAVPGLIAGSIGGAVGGYLGDVLFTSVGLPRGFGWMIMGAGIGIVEGLYERSPAKLRNGLIGGSIGGLVGGFLFDPIRSLIGASSGMSSRATAFVILGICIGLLIGLVKVVLKTAWLTVVDGYRPGRQLILAEGQAVLGRAEYATLPFLGRSNAELELEHARIIRQPDGRFAVEDNNTRLGTTVNSERVIGRALLKDDDVIKIGSNMIRFSERQRHADEPAKVATVSPTSYAPAPPPVTRPPHQAADATTPTMGGAPPVGGPPSLGTRPAPVIPPPPGGVKPAPVIPPPPGGVKPAPVIPPPPGGVRPAPIIPPPPGGVKPAPVIPPPPGGVRPAGGPPPLGARPAPVIPPARSQGPYVPGESIRCPQCYATVTKDLKRCGNCSKDLP